MTFLNGLLLGFTALGAVPIIIHILNRRRFRVVVWAAMRFLLATLDKNQRRLQIRDLILMALRAMALIFLALALARPTLAPGGFFWLGHRGETAAVVVLDNSMSMGYRVGADSRYEAARRAAKEAVEGLPKGSLAALVLMSDVALEEVPKPSHDLLFVGSEIGRAPLSDGGTDVFEGLRAAWNIVEGAEAAGREIYLITDMQKRGWPAPDHPQWRALVEEMRAARPPVSIYLIDMGGGAASENVCIEDIRTDDEIVTTDSTVAFDVTIRNHGPLAAEDVIVDLYVGAPGAAGAAPPRGSAPPRGGAAAPSGGDGADLHRVEHGMRKAASVAVESLKTVQTVRLEARLSRGGEYRIEARIPVTSDPRLEADNRRCLSLDVTGRIRVLLIDGDPADEGEPFGGETDFLEAALSPVDYESPDWKSPIETEVTNVYGLQRKRLPDYQAVVLANVGELSPGVVEGLRYFVMVEGGGLVIFLGDNVSPKRYNATLYTERDEAAAASADAGAGAGAGPRRVGLLPGKLGPALIENVRDEEEGFGLVTDDLSHPIMSFSPRSPGTSQGAAAAAAGGGRRTLSELLSKVRFFKAIPVELPAADPPAAGAAGRGRDPSQERTAGVRGPDRARGRDDDPSAEGEVTVVARFAGGEPAIVEKKLGRGKVLLASFTADKDWTDFPLRPAYVPVVKRAVQHVTLGRRPKKTIAVNGRIIEFMAARDAGRQVTVRDPRGGVRQVTATLAQRGSLAVAEYTRCHFAGFYELVVAPKRGVAPPRGVAPKPDGGGDVAKGESEARSTYFAANPLRTESDLAALTEEELSSRYPNFEFEWIEGAGDVRLALKEERAGREIWPFLFALALACLVAETVLVLLWAPKGA